MKHMLAKTAIALLAVTILAASPVQAQRRIMGFDAVQRHLSADRPYDGEDGGIIVNDNLRVYGGIALGAGHDSNIDDRSQNTDAGAFGRIELGTAIVMGPQANQTVLLATGSYSRHDIALRGDRYDAGVLLDHHVEISPKLGLTIGGFYFRDEVNFDSTQSLAGYYQLSHKGDSVQAFLRGRIFYRHYLAGVGSQMINFAFTDLDDSFDYIRVEQSAGILVQRSARMAPYVEVGYAGVNYINDINPQLLSRDGDEIWTIAGLRLTLADNLYLDIGGRFNSRWTEDPRISTFSSGFFDGKLVWQPRDGISIELAIDRKIVEPFEENAILADQTGYSLFVELEPRSNLTITAEAGYNDLRQIGTTSRYDEIYAEAKVVYQLARNFGLYSNLLALQSKNRTTSDTASRVRVESGVKLKF